LPCGDILPVCLTAGEVWRIEVIVTCDAHESKEAVAARIGESSPKELRV
jgi:hypothetical protein